MKCEDEQKLVFLKPGETMVTSAPVLVTTLLGSCVAVIMYSARHRTGAICHAQLPTCGKNSSSDHGHVDAGKYVDRAIGLMLERLAAKGVVRQEIQAKLFGGSDMFDPRGSGRSIGKQNMEAALRILESESIRVVGQDLGGGRGRKIIFHTDTGEVFVKRLGTSGI